MNHISQPKQWQKTVEFDEKLNEPISAPGSATVMKKASTQTPSPSCNDCCECHKICESRSDNGNMGKSSLVLPIVAIETSDTLNPTAMARSMANRLSTLILSRKNSVKLAHIPGGQDSWKLKEEEIWNKRLRRNAPPLTLIFDGNIPRCYLLGSSAVGRYILSTPIHKW